MGTDHLTVVLFSILLAVCLADKTPFCDFCTCLNDTSNPDVDCSNKLIASSLYKKELWYNAARNQSYDISTLNLQSINLGVLNEAFPDSSLTKLDLSHNGITHINDGVFANLEEMVELILSHNRLQDIGPNVFRGLRLEGYDYPLRSLQILRLDHNELHTLNQDIFEHIDRDLKVLSLAGNPFKVFDGQTKIAITSIVTLEELDLSYTQLEELPQYFLHTPQYLKKLDLSGNLLKRIPETFEDVRALEELILNGNPIVNITMEAGFPDMPTLKILHLCNMPELRKIGNHSLGGLENLEELYITDNIDLTSLSHATLIRASMENPIWPRIRKLSIKNNKLTHLNGTFLAKWDYLTMLDIRGNPWTCECENQWMIEELIPIIVGLNITQAKEIQCAAPVEMAQDTMYDIYERKSVMRCLDLYGNRPERDGAILMGILIGILIGIPLVLFALYAFQRNWFGFFDNSPAAYSRQFYKAPTLHEDGNL